MPQPIKIEAAGYTIERDEAGEWWMTPPASLYGYDSVAEMEASTGFPPSRETLSDAMFANAPSGDAIVSALCLQICPDARSDEEEAANPRCGCSPEVARRVIIDHGTCNMAGCPYGGDV